MTELIVISIGMVIAFLIGASVVFWAMYPQMRLLRSMVTDRHLGELRTKGQKSVMVEQSITAPVANPITTTSGHAEIKPPNIFDRRAEIEATELAQKRQWNEVKKDISHL